MSEHMTMSDGMAMADPEPCTAMPTDAEQKAAVDLVNSTWENSKKYQSLSTAKAAGFRPVTPSGRAVVHYINPQWYYDTAAGAPVLDPARPQSLVYANTPRGAILVAAMFIDRPGADVPNVGGCLTQWHVHTNLCIMAGRGVVGEVEGGCPPGSQNRVTPPMLHVWFVPVPGGALAVDGSDDDVLAAAAKVDAAGNPVA